VVANFSKVKDIALTSLMWVSMILHMSTSGPFLSNRTTFSHLFVGVKLVPNCEWICRQDAANQIHFLPPQIIFKRFNKTSDRAETYN
jgi:hypothetical protein